MFHYIDGGADDEVTLRRNSTAFERWELLPQQLRDVSQVNLRTTVLGAELEMPVILSPTGMSRLFHHHKELGVARAAAQFSTMYTVSTMATTSLEDIALAAGTGVSASAMEGEPEQEQRSKGSVPRAPQMFQIYIHKDREITREFVQRCKAAGYQALCLTVDTPLAGNRERDKVYGMTMPPRFTAKAMFDFAT